MHNEFDKEKVISVVKRTFTDVTVNDDIKLERMGGLTNRTYKVILESKNVVVRLPGEGTEELINRYDEKHSTELACKIGIDAHLYMFDESTGIKITEYIESSKTMSPETMREDKNIVLAAKLLYKLHNCGYDTGVQFDVINMAENYEKIIKANNVSLYKDYEDVKQFIRKIQQDYLLNVKKVPCHNDPLCENWILKDSKDMYLIDWEYAGMNDPMWDLADLSIEGNYDSKNDELLLESYFNKKPGKEEFKAFLINKVLIDYLWSLWGKTRVPYDGDIMEAYAFHRYIRMKESIKNLDLVV